jgi:glucose-6-phosphate 1-dehydrogenase
MNPSTAGANALLEGWQAHRPAPPCVMVVFGASGDLSSRKLMPALERLALRRELPGGFAVVGVARTPFNDEDFRRFARDAVSKYGAERPAGSDDVWRSVTESFRYIAGDYRDDDTFRRLSAVLDDIDRSRGTGGNRLYYLAVPPATFPIIVRALGGHRLSRPARGGATSAVRPSSTRVCTRCLRRPRSTGSTTTWERRRC